MGGIFLYGPNFRIYTKDNSFCYCFPYHARIDKETELFFINRPIKQISKTEFTDLINPPANWHISNTENIKYFITERQESEKEIDEYLKIIQG